MADVAEKLRIALEAPVQPRRASGCGRAYVVTTCDKPLIKEMKAACKKAGILFLDKAYGTSGKAIYIGYDNGTGHALAKAEAVAKSLSEQGISCYFDAVAD